MQEYPGGKFKLCIVKPDGRQEMMFLQAQGDRGTEASLHAVSWVAAFQNSIRDSTVLQNRQVPPEGLASERYAQHSYPSTASPSAAARSLKTFGYRTLYVCVCTVCIYIYMYVLCMYVCMCMSVCMY